MTLREMIHIVAEAMELGVMVMPMPMALQRLAVGMIESISSDPPSTTSQLRMLAEGMTGDGEPARRELGVRPRPFTVAGVRALESRISAWTGISLRMITSREHAEWSRRWAGRSRRALLLAMSAIGLMPVLTLLILDVWTRMAVNAAILIPMALLGVDLDWRGLFRFTWRAVAQGVIGAVVLYGCGAAVSAVLRRAPGEVEQIAAVYAWKSAVDPRWMLPLLLFIILGEEIVWRNAITLPLVGWLGPVVGTFLAALGFAAAHVALGVPLLLVAALGAGIFWSAMVVRYRSAVPALMCHIVWDAAVIVLWPY
jgi:membrane protease YdiL (CAAX protease family)